jgi:hypothetical protein
MAMPNTTSRYELTARRYELDLVLLRAPSRLVLHLGQLRTMTDPPLQNGLHIAPVPAAIIGADHERLSFCELPATRGTPQGPRRSRAFASPSYFGVFKPRTERDNQKKPPIAQ